MSASEVHSLKVYLIALPLKVSFIQDQHCTCNFPCNSQLSMWPALSDWKFCARNVLHQSLFYSWLALLNWNTHSETIDTKKYCKFCVRITLLDDGRALHSPLFKVLTNQGQILHQAVSNILDQPPSFRRGSALAKCKCDSMSSANVSSLQTENADAANVRKTPDTTLKQQKQIWRRIKRQVLQNWLFVHFTVAMSDTHVFLLNEYFVELNTANFNILNRFLNWILSENRKLNQLLNWILLKNENWINVWIEFVEKQKNE